MEHSKKPLDFGEELYKNPEAVNKYERLTNDTRQAVNTWANALENRQEMQNLVRNIAEGSEHDYYGDEME